MLAGRGVSQHRRESDPQAGLAPGAAWRRRRARDTDRSMAEWRFVREGSRKGAVCCLTRESAIETSFRRVRYVFLA